MKMAITLDLGPDFIGQVVPVDGEKVCVLSPTALSDAGVQARVRKMMWGQGVDCRVCRGCKVGTAE